MRLDAVARARAAQPPPLLADHPALELLNTRPFLRSDDPGELIADGGTLLVWLVAAGLLSRRDAAGVRRRLSRAGLDALATEARRLREALRTAVAAWALYGTAPTPALLTQLNRLMTAGPTTLNVSAVAGRIELAPSRSFADGAAILAPLAEAVARLFVEGDRALVRECGSVDCSLWFYDRTKAHRRHWCSMDLCGARAKSAAYRTRQRKPGCGKG